MKFSKLLTLSCILCLSSVSASASVKVTCPEVAAIQQLGLNYVEINPGKNIFWFAEYRPMQRYGTPYLWLFNLSPDFSSNPIPVENNTDALQKAAEALKTLSVKKPSYSYEEHYYVCMYSTKAGLVGTATAHIAQTG